MLDHLAHMSPETVIFLTFTVCGFIVCITWYLISKLARKISHAVVRDFPWEDSKKDEELLKEVNKYKEVTSWRKN